MTTYPSVSSDQPSYEGVGAYVHGTGVAGVGSWGTMGRVGTCLGSWDCGGSLHSGAVGRAGVKCRRGVEGCIGD